MSVIRLERIGSDGPLFRTGVHADSKCDSCAGCGIKTAQIELPQIQGDLAHLEMSMNDQWLMLMNSWLKPLLMVIISSLVCSLLSLTSLVEFSLVMAAFLFGFLMCREVPPAVLSINGESVEEKVND